MTPEPEASAGAEAVLITHDHVDRFEAERLYAAADAEPVDNVGFLLDGEVSHPGAALPLVDVPALLVQEHAPWMTMPDLIGYLREMDCAGRTRFMTACSASEG